MVAPILRCVSRGEFQKAKKIMFAQELVTGALDAGDWGGLARSNTEVYVKQRNSECCRVLQGFLSEYDESDKTREVKIAILYGAFHIKDLSSQLLSMGLEPAQSTSPLSELAAWTIPLEEKVPGLSASLFTRFGYPIAATALYLVLGTVDWYLLLRFVTEAIEAWTTPRGDNSVLASLAPGTAYLLTYIQRHTALHVRVSNVAVDWQRGLFDT